MAQQEMAEKSGSRRRVWKLGLYPKACAAVKSRWSGKGSSFVLDIQAAEAWGLFQASADGMGVANGKRKGH